MRLYLREVRDAQAKARGIAYEKKKRKKPQQQQQQLQSSNTYPNQIQQGDGSGGGVSGGFAERNMVSRGLVKLGNLFVLN